MSILTVAAGRRHKGLLVEIGYDPRQTNKNQLREWERGQYGEIFR